MKTTLNITNYEPYGRLQYHGQWRLFWVKKIVFSSLLVRKKNNFYSLAERKCYNYGLILTTYHIWILVFKHLERISIEEKTASRWRPRIKESKTLMIMATMDSSMANLYPARAPLSPRSVPSHQPPHTDFAHKFCTKIARLGPQPAARLPAPEATAAWK